MRPYRLLTPASDDLVAILDYLNGHSTASAERFLNGLDHRLRLLAQQPNSGHARPEFGHDDLRYITFSSYIVAFYPDTSPLSIAAIIHGSRPGQLAQPCPQAILAMNDLYARATTAATHIRSVTLVTPTVAIVLGSGLGDFAAQVQSPTTIPYADIPHFPQSTVAGHSGKLVLGTLGGVPVAVMQGRVHAYEGYAMDEVTFPMRVLSLLGVRTVVVTNAAGGIRATLTPGELVCIGDHINLTGTNAALGPNEPRFATRPGTGERFFDMTTAYTPRLRALAVAAGARQGFTLTEGVYLAVLGPSFETPAEIRAFRTLGADLVGMSTVHEVIVARHMGLEVLGLSLVTNMAAGVTGDAIHHEEVMEIGRHAASRFTSLLTALVPQLVG